MSDDPSGVCPDLVEELPAFLDGSLPVARHEQALAHLRGCDSCRRQLVEVAAASALLRDVGRLPLPEPTAVPPLRVADLTSGYAETAATAASFGEEQNVGAVPLPDRRRPRRPVRLAAVAAVAALLAVLGGVGLGRGPLAPGPSGAITASVRLVPASAESAAAGTARMVGAGAQQHMHVHVTGLPAGATYSVTLVDTATGASLMLGLLPPGGDAVLPAPAAELVGYDQVDVTPVAPGRGAAVLRGSLA